LGRLLRGSAMVEVDPAGGLSACKKETDAAQRRLHAARVTTAVVAEHRPEDGQALRNLLTTDAPHQGEGFRNPVQAAAGSPPRWSRRSIASAAGGIASVVCLWWVERECSVWPLAVGSDGLTGTVRERTRRCCGPVRRWNGSG
jgi:hypothetical protein